MSDIFKCYFTYVAIMYAPIEAFFVEMSCSVSPQRIQESLSNFECCNVLSCCDYIFSSELFFKIIVESILILITNIHYTIFNKFYK